MKSPAVNVNLMEQDNEMAAVVVMMIGVLIILIIHIMIFCVIWQIEDLQLSLCRMEKEHGRREDILRQEISDLHQVCSFNYQLNINFC